MCSEVGFRRETYHLAQSYVDLYLSRKQPEKASLQLLGSTSLFIAMKIEEIQHSSVNSFVSYAGGNAFTAPQIIEKEREMMTTLKWKIYPDTLNTWMDSYLN